MPKPGSGSMCKRRGNILGVLLRNLWPSIRQPTDTLFARIVQIARREAQFDYVVLDFSLQLSVAPLGPGSMNDNSES